MGKPPITANQVTLLRLLLLPIGGMMFYYGVKWQWVNLVFMTLLGCTDFIDGWLARRYGSTELGRLMDPIADKVFVVVIFMPFIDLGWMPGWQVGLMLSREFVVTALRSMYERRKTPPATAFLGKVKAWAQMAGCAFLFMLKVVPRREMIILISVFTALPVLMALLRWLITGYLWRVIFIFAAWVVVLMLPYVVWGAAVTFQFLALTVIGITWLSAWGYVAPALKLAVSGKFDAGDWARILGSIALPIVLVMAQMQPNDILPAWAIILTMCLEMALGGLDNLLCVHDAQSGAFAWGLRVGLVTALTAGALYLADQRSPQAAWLIYGACLVSLIGTAMAFYRGRRYYMEEPATPRSPSADD